MVPVTNTLKFNNSEFTGLTRVLFNVKSTNIKLPFCKFNVAACSTPPIKYFTLTSVSDNPSGWLNFELLIITEFVGESKDTTYFSKVANPSFITVISILPLKSCVLEINIFSGVVFWVLTPFTKIIEFS